MSCFLVSDKHINAIVTYAIDKDVWVEGLGVPNVSSSVITEDRAEGIAQILADANQASVNERYIERASSPDIKYECVDGLSAVEIIKLCTCYMYQSNEASSWNESMALRIVQAVINCAAIRVDGWNEAEWTI